MNSQNLMDRPAHRITSILAVSALALGLAACGKTEEPTVGPVSYTHLRAHET